MTKDEAIKLLGGTPSQAARACRITSAAVAQWRDPLPDKVIDRVQAALWRKSQAGAATKQEPEKAAA